MEFGAFSCRERPRRNTVGLLLTSGAPAFPSPASHAMQPPMGDERVIELIGRVDRALARIEAAAQRPVPPQVPADDSRAAALEAAHRALRTRVETAIVQIDRLLAAGEN